ncbi:hypothetical protein Hanom_Chr12g01079101 [Helianthus anomalus]
MGSPLSHLKGVCNSKRVVRTNATMGKVLKSKRCHISTSPVLRMLLVTFRKPYVSQELKVKFSY